MRLWAAALTVVATAAATAEADELTRIGCSREVLLDRWARRAVVEQWRGKAVLPTAVVSWWQAECADAALVDESDETGAWQPAIVWWYLDGGYWSGKQCGVAPAGVFGYVAAERWQHLSGALTTDANGTACVRLPIQSEVYYCRERCEGLGFGDVAAFVTLLTFLFAAIYFIDLCILLGCDYCPGIRGIGQKKAFDLIKQHGSIEDVVKHLDKTKYTPPEDWQFEQARKLFLEPEVCDVDESQLKWQEPDEDGLVEFMCNEKNFMEERIRAGAKKLMKGKHSSTQGRIDSFFTVTTSVSCSTKPKTPQQQPKKRAAKGTAGGPKKRAK